MKKNILANSIAFIIGIYFIVRAYFWFTSKEGKAIQNKYFALIYCSVGILAILIQLIANYRKRKKEK